MVHNEWVFRETKDESNGEKRTDRYMLFTFWAELCITSEVVAQNGTRQHMREVVALEMNPHEIGREPTYDMKGIGAWLEHRLSKVEH